MNGVRRFLGGGTSVSNSPPTIPSDVPPLVITGKSSWPPRTPSPVQIRPDSPAESSTISNQALHSRQDRKKAALQGEDNFGNVSVPLINGTSSVSSTRGQTSFTSSPSHPARSSSPVARPSPSRAPPPTHLLSRQSVNPQDSEGKGTSAVLNTRDELLISLLASEAVVDSRGFEILSAEEVEDLKKELQVLNSRSEAMTKKLTLETKIRDAAISLSKVNASHKKVSKQSEEQLDAANRRVDAAQKEMWRVSERANEVHRRLLEHRTSVLSLSVRTMEKKMNCNDTEDAYSSSSMTGSMTSSMTSMSTYSNSRFDGAHLFAGHADAQIPTPRRLPGAAQITALEEKLKAATDALSDANKKQAEMARELSHLRLEKQEVETMMEMDLQSAKETINALEKELPRLESQDSQLREMLQERSVWEKDRAMLTERTRQVEDMERRLKGREQQKGDAALIAETKESCRRALELKEAEMRELKQQWAIDREAWEREKARMEDEKLEDFGRLQDEVDALRRDDNLALQKAHAEVDESLAVLRSLVQQHGIVLFSRESSLQGLLSSIGTYLDSVSAKIDAYDTAKDEWENLRRKLEEDVRNGLDKRETLVREVEEARREREDARRDLRSLETRLKDQTVLSNPGSSASPSSPSSETSGEVMSVLYSLWAILPSPEARAAKFGGQRHFRAGTPTSPGSPKPSLTSLSELDVRTLKMLYDSRATPMSPHSTAFSLDGFAARVQALITDDRSLIERLIRFAQAHDLLKKNAERAQKLAQESNNALETYQKQVRTLEDRNMSLAARQAELQDEVQELQRAVDRISAERRDIEMQAAEQAETCRQLTEANNTLSSKTLTLAEEAASAPERVRKQLEGQLAECRTLLGRAQDEIDMLRTSEQSQRIALLDELNLMQTENGNLRAQLRAVKR